MLLFRSEEWIDKWCQRNNLERGEVLTIHQVWELSKLWYHNRLSWIIMDEALSKSQRFSGRQG